ncbi:AMP-binding protein [Amycolatopsis jejuensis]|uniref:AMP-binding protein n=1 Tax=Amycolatopsis jejuensis TaxID=330084 RepID=UPI0005277DF8|nr:AMP-binding protein [Amycolatopsis jejuensis]
MPVPLNIRDFLDRAEAGFAARIAAVDEPVQPAPPWGELTYGAFAAAARGLAARLDDLGVERGARVAFLSQNSARLLAAFFGVSGWGRVLVPVNYRLARPEIEQILDHSGAQVLFTDPSCAELVQNTGVPHRFVLGADDDFRQPGREPAEWAEADELAPATLNYTSGTTGAPKGVVLSHRSLWLNAATFGLHTGLSDRDVYLHTLPMFHVNGWGMPYAVTAAGAKHVVLRQVDGAEILRRIEQHGVTLLCAAPTVVESVLAAAETWPGEIPGRGRVRVVVAGAPPRTGTVERVETVLGWELIQIFGQTETSPLITVTRTRAEWDPLTPRERAQRLRRAGVPALGVKVRISPAGEVLTRSNHNLTGYWRNEQATAESGAATWVRTGDVGHVDPDGHLVITDRKKDIVISGGENVASVEVEDVLTAHPAVHEAAVIGTPDEKWGELVTALVVPGDPAPAEADLIEHCRAHLAGYKCPKRVVFVDRLVRTATGKLQKNVLRDKYAAGSSGAR